jgi:hypothetical protein
MSLDYLRDLQHQQMLDREQAVVSKMKKLFGGKMNTSLTMDKKLHALSMRFYDGFVWTPKAGDHYTTSRNDLELYRVVKIENKKVFTEYCENPGSLSEWDQDGFTTEGFGPKRVYVHECLLQD